MDLFQVSLYLPSSTINKIKHYTTKPYTAIHLMNFVKKIKRES